jgi:hypothetical protein
MALDDFNCVHCTPPTEESLIHLFLACPFANACWATLHLHIQQPSDAFGTLSSFKNQLQLPLFMEIIVTMCWSIWTVMNDAIFRQIPPSVQRCKAIFRKEFAQVILRAKSSSSYLFAQWLEAYV